MWMRIFFSESDFGTVSLLWDNWIAHAGPRTTKTTVLNILKHFRRKGSWTFGQFGHQAYPTSAKLAVLQAEEDYICTGKTAVGHEARSAWLKMRIFSSRWMITFAERV